MAVALEPLEHQEDSEEVEVVLEFFSLGSSVSDQARFGLLLGEVLVQT